VKAFGRFGKFCRFHLTANESRDIREGALYRFGGVWKGGGYHLTHHPLADMYKDPRQQLQLLPQRREILLYAVQHLQPSQRTGHSREVLKIIITENSRSKNKQGLKERMKFIVEQTV